MNDALTHQRPTVEGNDLIHCCQVFTFENCYVHAKILFFIT